MKAVSVGMMDGELDQPPFAVKTKQFDRRQIRMLLNDGSRVKLQGAA
jgi:hypothetical protein